MHALIYFKATFFSFIPLKYFYPHIPAAPIFAFIRWPNITTYYLLMTLHILFDHNMIDALNYSKWMLEILINPWCSC